MNLERQFNRNLRYSAGIKQPTVLDNFNNREDNRSRYLHPTKGYRTFSVKRGKAAMITADEMKKGMFPPAIISWRKIKQILLSDLPA